MKKILLALIACLLTVGVIQELPLRVYASQIPQLFTYEGKYVSPDNTPMPDGIYDLVFSLYEVQSGGSAIWTEVHRRADGNGVQVSKGKFKVVLGKNMPLPNFSSNYWLAIVEPITGREKVQREALLSAPYALAIAPSVDLPIGSIIAWHKSMGGTPQELPYKWVECNGQIVADSESPYIGEIIPNLNGHPDGEMMSGFETPDTFFLRGGLESGNVQWDALQQHGHETDAMRNQNEKKSGSGDNRWTAINGGIINEVKDARVADETRPKNMSVVWIMKIK